MNHFHTQVHSLYYSSSNNIQGEAKTAHKTTVKELRFGLVYATLHFDNADNNLEFSALYVIKESDLLK